MMSIVWIIIGYLVVGVCLAIWYAKLGKGTAEHCIGMVYGWPLILFIGIFIVWPTEWFNKLIKATKEKNLEKERAEKRKKLEENCANCARNNSEMCPEWLKPLTSSCYDKPREEKKNDQTK